MKIPQGPPGQKGDPGTCICNATALMSSFTMPKMIQGPKGEPGIPGQEGKQGLMGLTVSIFILIVILRYQSAKSSVDLIYMINLVYVYHKNKYIISKIYSNNAAIVNT